MRVRGYYGTIYDIPEDNPLPAIDRALSSIHENYPDMPHHPDLDTLLDKRAEMMKALHAN